MNCGLVMFMLSQSALAQMCPSPAVWSSTLQQCVGGESEYVPMAPVEAPKKVNKKTAGELDFMNEGPVEGELQGRFLIAGSVITAGGVGVKLGRETHFVNVNELITLGVDSAFSAHLNPFRTQFGAFFAISASPTVVFHIVPQVLEASAHIGPALGIWPAFTNKSDPAGILNHALYVEIGARGRVKSPRGRVWFDLGFSLLLNVYMVALPQITLGVVL